MLGCRVKKTVTMSENKKTAPRSFSEKMHTGRHLVTIDGQKYRLLGRLATRLFIVLKKQGKL